MDNVVLIASGYEWTCPECDELNHEIEIENQVSCKNCNVVFEVTECEHAYH